MADDLSNIVLFGGNLKELDNFTNEIYQIAGEYFESEGRYHLFLEEKVKKHLRELGFDGLIHRQNHKEVGLLIFLFDFQFRYMTGVPVKLIEGK